MQTILKFLGTGDSIEQLLAAYPNLTREDILAALRYSSRLMASSANSTMTLNAEDTAWFIDLLKQPAPEPTPAMKRASARRRELLGS